MNMHLLECRFDHLLQAGRNPFFALFSEILIFFIKIRIRYVQIDRNNDIMFDSIIEGKKISFIGFVLESKPSYVNFVFPNKKSRLHRYHQGDCK